MKNCLKKKKILFDGDQDHLVEGAWQVDCCSCGEKISFGIEDCKSFFLLESEVKSIVLPELKKVESKTLGDATFYKVDGLPLHFFKATCSSCGVTNLCILGRGEYQPARYMIQMVGLMIL